MSQPSNTTATIPAGLKSLTKSSLEDPTKIPLKSEPFSNWTADGQSTDPRDDQDESKDGATTNSKADTSTSRNDAKTGETSVGPATTGQ
jgi:hypothetical protein